nr:hypothetical protein Saspl_047305 [Ipomoea trifida]
MLEGASPLSDRSASSRKSKEVITDEPHAGKLARVVLAGLPEVAAVVVASGFVDGNKGWAVATMELPAMHDSDNGAHGGFCLQQRCRAKPTAG